MLQSRNLDDQRYEEIVAHALGRIPQLCPRWTNYNGSDPGITLLELLAWYKEMQQYHMNACTEEIRRKLLELAGGEIRGARAAECGISLPESVRGEYAALTRLETPEGVVFELAEAITDERCVVAACCVENEGGLTDVTAMLRREEAGIEPFSFGSTGRSEFLIGFSELPRERVRLWFEVQEPKLRGRNEFEEEGQVPRRIRWIWEGTSEAVVERDATHGLSRSGYLTIAIPEDLREAELGPARGARWWLRGVLEDGGCEERVCLTGVDERRYRAVQRETWSRSRQLRVERVAECGVYFDDWLSSVGSYTVFLRESEGWRQISGRPARDERGRAGVMVDSRTAAEDGSWNLRVVYSDPIHYGDLFHDSTGLPEQSIRLELGGRQVLSEEFCLICETLEADGSVRPEAWRCVEDFYQCGPRDRVFVYDAASESIRFGDGRHGAIVPRGETAIFLSDMTVTECGGGNIPAGARLRFSDDGSEVWNTAARGGAERESVASASARFLDRLECAHRCVTEGDYEREALGTPGLRVSSARALPGYDPEEPTGRSRHPVVTVVVIPANEERLPMPDRRFLETVERYLNRLRPIGTVVRVIAPEYIGVTVSCELRTSGPVSEERLQAAVSECLGLNGGRRIGAAVSRHEIAMALQGEREVMGVSRVQLRAEGAGCRETAWGDIQVPRNAVAYLKEWSFTVR